MARAFCLALAVLFAYCNVANACGGGGSAFKDWVDQVATPENAFSVAEYSVTGNTAASPPGFIMTIIYFFSGKYDKDDPSNFVKGLDAVTDEPGKMGKKAALRSGMTEEQYESLLK